MKKSWLSSLGTKQREAWMFTPKKMLQCEDELFDTQHGVAFGGTKLLVPFNHLKTESERLAAFLNSRHLHNSWARVLIASLPSIGNDGAEWTCPVWQQRIFGSMETNRCWRDCVRSSISIHWQLLLHSTAADLGKWGEGWPDIILISFPKLVFHAPSMRQATALPIW